ncbi:MAG: prepilin-type N-terminal cleavage/methylation domain-containing protein [Parcubacteria group bacterium]|nr:MAG: prepilin-type N-terminal cleavage/methylation domain-containing protein [Parcubacteria group bacterium]
MENKIKKINKKGYTLIEILVGISIFMILIAASTEFFVSSLEMQQEALISQRLLDNVSYSFEYMSRALRMAQKSDGSCSGMAADANYEKTLTENGGIRFVNYKGDCQEFYLSWPSNNVKSLMVKIGTDPALPITPEYLNVVSFNVSDENGSWDDKDSYQPRVTIFLEGKGLKSNKPELHPIIKIQTTISQRNLDI